MLLKKGFTLRPLGDEYILLAEGAEVVNFNKMLTLNETAAFLYRKAEEADGHFTPEELATWILSEYDATPEQAAADANALANKWLAIGICE